jgi:hypothetical protein
MNRDPSRFRPCLEALEERSLLSVTVSYDGSGGMAIDLRQSTASHHIDVANDGNGRITASVTGEGGGTFDFHNVNDLVIDGGPGGVGISYSQLGDQVYRNPLGNPFGYSFALLTTFEGNTNNLTASFAGRALLQSVLVDVLGGSGHDMVSVNATGVPVGAFARFQVLLSPNYPGAGGLLNFAMDYSGVNRGALGVVAQPGTYAVEDLRLEATFLGTDSTSRLTPSFLQPHGASPGDLSLSGGTPGNNSMEMYLFSPGGLPLTGDVYGTGPGGNTCFRTANVKAHNCQQNHVVGVSSVAKLTRLPALNPAFFLQP